MITDDHCCPKVIRSCLASSSATRRMATSCGRTAHDTLDRGKVTPTMARGNCWIKMGSLGCTWTKGWVSSIQNEMAHETHLKSCHIHMMSYNISCRINIVCVTVRIFWNWWFLDMFFNGSVDLKLDLLAMTPGKWFIEGNGRKEWSTARILETTKHV